MNVISVLLHMSVYSESFIAYKNQPNKSNPVVGRWSLMAPNGGSDLRQKFWSEVCLKHDGT